MRKIEKWMLDVTPEELPDPYSHLARKIGLEATLQLAVELGGENVYFGKLDVKLRNRRILKEYDGYNVKKLAAKYGLTRRRVEQIVQTLTNI